MTRLSVATKHLRSRLRTVAGKTGNYLDADGNILHQDVEFLAIDYRKVVRQQEDNRDSVSVHPFLVGLDQVSAEPEEGHQIVIGNRTFAVVRDEVTGTHWQWHDTEDKQRVIFTTLWSES